PIENVTTSAEPNLPFDALESQISSRSGLLPLLSAPAFASWSRNCASVGRSLAMPDIVTLPTSGCCNAAHVPGAATGGATPVEVPVAPGPVGVGAIEMPVLNVCCPWNAVSHTPAGNAVPTSPTCFVHPTSPLSNETACCCRLDPEAAGEDACSR